MASKKGSKEIIKLENKETGYFYTVTKNNKTATGKVKRRKYDPKLRKHVDLLPPIPPSIRVFSNESTLCLRWPEYWSYQL